MNHSDYEEALADMRCKANLAYASVIGFWSGFFVNEIGERGVVLLIATVSLCAILYYMKKSLYDKRKAVSNKTLMKLGKGMKNYLHALRNYEQALDEKSLQEDCK